MPPFSDFWNIFHSNMQNVCEFHYVIEVCVVEVASLLFCATGLNSRCNLIWQWMLAPLLKNLMKPLLTQLDAVTKVEGSLV
jgi:hypothetical protein